MKCLFCWKFELMRFCTLNKVLKNLVPFKRYLKKKTLYFYCSKNFFCYNHVCVEMIFLCVKIWYVCVIKYHTLKILCNLIKIRLILIKNYTAPCASSPCQNGFACSNTASDPFYDCDCLYDYSGTNCETCTYFTFL